MDSRGPTLRSFVAAFFAHWIQGMSGGIAVLATALALGAGQDQNNRLIFEGTALVAFAFASYRVWAAERTARNAAENRVAQLESEYAHSINLGTIDVAEDYVLDGKGKKVGRKIQFQPIFQNVIHRPVEFQVKRSVFDGSTFPSSQAAIITSGVAMRFFSQHISGAFPAPKTATDHFIELEYTYGEPGNHSRSAKKIIILTRQPDGKIAWAYQTNEDRPCQ